MSDGEFIRSVYGRASGTLHPIKVQPETLTLDIDGVVNAAAGAEADSNLVAQVSAGRRSIGLHARLVRLKVEVGGTTDIEPGSILTLPWLDPDTFDDATEPPGKPFTYRDGVTGTVVGNSPEKYRG